MMRPWFLYIAGLIVVLMGCVWIGQGSGYFPYPASSPMIDNRIWELWGAVAIGVGVVLAAAGHFVFGRR